MTLRHCRRRNVRALQGPGVICHGLWQLRGHDPAEGEKTIDVRIDAVIAARTASADQTIANVDTPVCHNDGIFLLRVDAEIIGVASVSCTS